MGRDAADLQSPNVNVLLREGIAAAKSGQRERAHELLTRVVEQDEENVSAWLWLSGVVDSLDDRAVCLENILTLDPDNDTARNGLTLIYRQKADHLLRQGIAATKSGQREHAHDLLARAVELDEENVSAWLWLSGVVDSLDERGICLENVLAFDPNNDAARRGLASVRQQKEAQSPSPASEPEPPVVARARTAPTPAAAILREDFASRQPPPEPEPEPPLATTLGQLDDEFLCPYCAAPTEPKDRKCKACGSELWIKFRRQEKRSTLLWVLIAFQFFNTFQLAMLPVLVLGYAIVKSMLSSLAGLDASDPLALLNVYLGRPTTLSPGAVHAALAAVPRSVFILSFLPCLFSGVVLIGLYLRWKPVYYLFTADALVVVATAFMAMFLGKNLIYGGFGLGLALLRLLLVFQIEDDFQWEKRRLVLGIDRGLASGADFVIRGDFYAKRKMWAMAAIHLRRAVGWMPTDPGSRMALAVAYIRLKRYDRAAQTLAEASRISPGSPRVAELTALLDELRSAGSSP